MKKVFLIPLLILLVSGLVLGACAKPAPAPAPAPKPAPEKVWELKFHHHTKGKTGDVLAEYAKNIEDATKGRVKITIYPSATLGKAKEAYELCATGTADISWGFVGFFPGQFPMTETPALPMMGAASAKHVTRVLHGLNEKFPEQFAKEYGEVKMLTVHSSGVMPTSTIKKPIRKMEDFKGMKIRTPAGPATEMMKALGSTPMTISVKDLYSALEKGVVEGCNFGMMAVKDFKLTEILNYFHRTNLYSSTFWVVINRNVWDSMPADVQEQIMSVSGLEGGLFLAAGWDKLDVESWEYVSQLPGKEVIIYPPEERARWAERAESVWAAHVEKLNAKGLPGQEVLDYAKKLFKELAK